MQDVCLICFILFLTWQPVDFIRVDLDQSVEAEA